jgi:hypothetical protein
VTAIPREIAQGIVKAMIEGDEHGCARIDGYPVFIQVIFVDE